MTHPLRLVGPEERPDAAPTTGPLEGLGVLDVAVRFPRLGSEVSSDAVRHDLRHHEHSFGPRRPQADGGARLLRDLQHVGLTGRGGGHFPSARKWQAVRDGGGGAVVVVNGAEGEPCSAKDAAVLQYRPHLVLDGAQAAAEVVGADDVVVWLHEGADATRRSVEQAVLERRATGRGDAVVHVRTGPAHYLSGESSAVVRGLSGGPVLPEFRRVPTAVSGVHGRATLLSNVETFARAALVDRTGAHAYRAATLLTVLGRSDRVVVELTPQHTLADAVALQWPADSAAPSAVLLGGYGGVWARWDDVAALRVDEPAARATGRSLGAGIVAPLPARRCGLGETARILAYLAASSAQQCGPCMFGLPAVADLVAALVAGPLGRGDRRRLDRFLAEVDGRGGCHLPDGAVRLAVTALEVFADDVAVHARRGRCLHGDAGGLGAVVPVPDAG